VLGVLRKTIYLFSHGENFAPQLGQLFFLTRQQKVASLKGCNKLPTAIHPFAVGKTMLCRRLFDALPPPI